MKKNPFAGFLQVLKAIFIILWVVFSTIVYGIFAMLVSGFSEKAGRWITRLWCGQLAFLSGVKVIIRGLEKLNPSRNYLFIANHISYYDIIVLINALPYKLSFIAKKSLFFIPIWGWSVALTGHIAINRSNPKNARKSIQRASVAIRKHRRSVVGFPEGTRSRTGKMSEFKLGLFGLAIQTGIDIVPLAIHGTKHILPRGSVIIRSGTVYIDVTEPIHVRGYTQRDKNILVSKAWNAIHDLVEVKKEKSQDDKD